MVCSEGLKSGSLRNSLFWWIFIIRKSRWMRQSPDFGVLSQTDEMGLQVAPFQTTDTLVFLCLLMH